MGERYNVNERISGGSMSPRLNPRITDDRLNAKLGPDRPNPVIRETSGRGCVYENGNARRRGLIGLSSRFDRGG